MANYADKETDERLARMEVRLAEIYKDASNDLQARSNEYFDSFAKRYEEQYDAYLDGAYTDQEFKMWWYNQIGRGERWQMLKTDMAQKMTQTNQIAAAYINDNTPGIFSLNANYSAYEIEKGTGAVFNLVREDTVKALINDQNFSEFRTLSVNPKRDYEWNQQQIQKSLLSGILQGNSIKRLAKRYEDVMGANKNAAIRNARTSVTSAQNGGRQHTFNAAQDMGIEIKKEWVATTDARTRDSHRELDGVIVGNNDKFPNGCMYPGDPAGHPSEVYNCRCAMVPVLPKYHNKRINAINNGNNTVESYKTWKKSKEAGLPAFKLLNYDDNVTKYTAEMAMQECKELHYIINDYLPINDRWKGSIVIKNGDIPASKEWDCSISIKPETHKSILMHEMLHARSCSYDNSVVYIRNQTIEEASVQYLTQELCARHNIDIVESGYDDNVLLLRELRGIIKPNISDLDFALDIMKHKLSRRTEWLEDEVNAAMMQRLTIEEYQRCSTILEALNAR